MRNVISVIKNFFSWVGTYEIIHSVANINVSGRSCGLKLATKKRFNLFDAGFSRNAIYCMLYPSQIRTQSYI